jgi:S1-C subfamily serine protease
MNSLQIFNTVGLGALAVTLIALPGSSAHKQDPPCPQARSQVQMFSLEDADRDIAETQQAVRDLRIVSDDDGPGDVQVIVDDGHGWLGVGVSEVTTDKMKELNLPAERGVVLGKIVPYSPAAKAGLKEKDVITEVNGQRVEGTEQFRRMIREIPAGRTAQFIVWRDGRAQTVSVTVGKSQGPHMGTKVISPGTFAFNMPEQLSHLGDMFEFAPWTNGRARLGIDAEDLDGEFGNYFGAPDGEGVLVRGVFPDTPAAKAGLKVGDVITSVDGDSVRSIGELREKLVEKKEQKSVKLGLLRDKTPRSLSVELPPPVQKQEHHTSLRTNI